MNSFLLEDSKDPIGHQPTLDPGQPIEVTYHYFQISKRGMYASFMGPPCHAVLGVGKLNPGLFSQTISMGCFLLISDLVERCLYSIGYNSANIHV